MSSVKWRPLVNIGSGEGLVLSEITSKISLNIGSNNGLVPLCTKPLIESMLTYHTSVASFTNMD